ncbi:DUF1835 domain-containing protein [Paenibacillus rhizoplanae]
MSYDAKARTAAIEKDSVTVKFTIGSKSVSVNGVAGSMDTVPVMEQNSMFIPVSVLAGRLGIVSKWDQASQLYTLTGETLMQTDMIKYTLEDMEGGPFTAPPGKIISNDAFRPVSYTYDPGKGSFTVKAKNITGKDIPAGAADVAAYILYDDTLQFPPQERVRPAVRKEGTLEVTVKTETPSTPAYLLVKRSAARPLRELISIFESEVNPVDGHAGDQKKAVSTLRDEEVKQYLTGILAGIGELKEQHGQLERPLDKHMAEPVAELIEQYSSLMSLPAQRAFWDPAPDSTHVHILCGDSFGGSMKQVLKEFGWTATHKLIILRENYAIGPLDQLDTPVGRKLRSDWFRQHIHEYYTVSDECEREYSELLDNLEQIPEQAKIIIWTSGNACEQTGLRLIAHLLGKRPNEIIVCDACEICEELFNRPDAYINYYHSGEIPSDKLREALLRIDEGSRLGAADIARLSQEWKEISRQSGALRIWQGGYPAGGAR